MIENLVYASFGYLIGGCVVFLACRSAFEHKRKEVK